MKAIKRIISFTIWAVIVLNVFIIGMSHMPVAQRYAGAKLAETASKALGTTVSVGRVDLGLLNRIIIDDLVIHDQQQEEMLRAARVSVKIGIMSLAQGKISISSAQLFGAHARLYQQREGEQNNFQFLLDSLASKDTTSNTPLDLRINSLIIRRSSVSYDRRDKPETEGLLNPAHLKISDISAHLNLKALTDDSLNVNVKRISLKEQAGLDINRLAFRLEAGRHNLSLNDLVLQMPNTHVQMDALTASYQLNGQELVPGTLTFNGEILNTSIMPSDLRCFESSLKNFQRQLSFHTTFHGTDHRITIPAMQLTSLDKDLDVNIDGWLEKWQSQWAAHLQMNHIRLTENSLAFLTNAIPQLPQELKRLGDISVNGTLDRNMQGTLSMTGNIQAGGGSTDLQFSMDHQQQFSGHIEANELNLRQLLDNEQFGSMTASLSLNGSLNRETPDINADGTVHKIDYNGYTYQNITLNGDYARDRISGSVGIDDPNVALNLQGLVSEARKGNEKPVRKIQLEGTVNHFVPTALRLTNEWEDADISADINADFTASSLNDAEGSLRISRFGISGTEHYAPYTLDNLMVSSGYDEGIHYVMLKSDFADATLKGAFDYTTLVQSITNLVGSKLPTLPGLPPVNKQTNNNFSLRLMLSKADWLKRFFDVDLQLRQPVMLNARVNDKTQDLYLDGLLPSFAYNGAWYSDGGIHVTTPGDTLNCDISIKKLLEDGGNMSADLLVAAANNRLNTSLSWDNHATKKHISGQLNSIIHFYSNLERQPEAHLRIQPSQVILNNAVWEVEPSDIIYHKNRLLVDNFMVHRGQQHILIDGIASKNSHDSLKVDLNELEVAYILDLVDFHTVEFSGKATGRAVASNLFDKFAASANLRVDDFKFEEGRMGVLNANVNWNQTEEQIDIKAVAADGPGVNTFIEGYVSPTHDTIDLAFQADSTYIDFMHSFTNSFLSHVTGHATGDLRLAGPLSNINLTGELVVNGEATVESLNTTYYLEGDTVRFVPDEIELHRLPLHDKENNKAWLSGGIHHQHLTNLTFDLDVETDNLLAYDFHDFGDSNFYGTVYAAGNVTLQGRPGEVTINCDVTPLKNTVFVYNASNPDGISKQEFIEWETEPTDGDSEASLAKQTGTETRPQIQSTNIFINFNVNTTPDATVKLLMDANTGDYITLNGEGSIRATFYNKGAFNMFGTYTVDHGTYDVTIQNIITKNFIFNRGGTFTFGGDPYQAALNLQAVNTVSGVSLSDLSIGNSFSSNTIRVNCLMNITGQAASPQIDFDLEMPTVNADEQQMVRSVINGQQEMNQQVFYLLSIGRFYQPGVNNAENGDTDQASRTMQSLLSGTLSAQINNLLNQFAKTDNWNFGANITTGNEGWHNAEYEGTVNARMLNNRLLLNGQFGYRDNATKATPSFIGDFDLQYLLFPNGDLALKVYNQTNDRYFTKSSLNTQGLGIIMKRDFNGLRDLFSNKKRKKTQKKKN